MLADSGLESIQNCKWHHQGVCLICDTGFYLDFETFQDGNLKCSPCVKACDICHGPGTKDCTKVTNGFRYSLRREKIEGCGVIFKEEGKNLF
jgi:hypothetical protein